MDRQRFSYVAHSDMQEWQHLATDLECSTYEDQYARNVENYVAANTDDEHFIRFGRSTLGFGLYLFGKNSQ